MATLNLVPGNEYLELARRRQRRLLIGAGVGAVVFILIWGVLLGMRASVASNVKETQGRLRAVEAEIAKLDTVAERIRLFEQRIVALSALLDQHVSWGPLLQEIERLMPLNTRLLSVAAQANDGVIEISGLTPNLDELAQTIASLRHSPQHTSLFSEVSLGDVDLRSTEPGAPALYRFTLVLTFDPTVIRSNSSL